LIRFSNEEGFQSQLKKGRKQIGMGSFSIFDPISERQRFFGSEKREKKIALYTPWT
jgi:hypothetical protein